MSYFDFPNCHHMIGTLSLLGLYSYDNTIFDDFAVPDGIDKDNIITMLCAETSDCELLYPNPHVLKKLIKAWSEMRLPTWQKVYDAINADYDVLDERLYTEEIRSTATTESESNGSSASIDTSKANASVAGRGLNSTEMLTTNTNSSNGEDRNASTNTSDNNSTSAAITTRSGKGRNKSGAELVPLAVEAAMNNLYDIIMNEFKERFIILVY